MEDFVYLITPILQARQIEQGDAREEPDGKGGGCGGGRINERREGGIGWGGGDADCLMWMEGIGV